MLITPRNLILIGFEQSNENKNIYLRHDGSFNFVPSLVGFMESSLSNKTSEVEAEERSLSYIKWKKSIEKEIAEKLKGK